MKWRFDPRTILYLLIISQLVLFLDGSIVIEIITVIILIIPFLLTRQFYWGIGISVVYILQLLATFFLLPKITSPVLLYPLSMVSNGFRELIPGMMIGIYAIKFTSLGEWISLFKKWHFPKFFTVTFAVFFRFFPTIQQDYQQIRNAMAFRGIERGILSFVKQPRQTFEFILIPLLMNASQVAQDLTIAALTKGLSMPGKQTSLIQLQMTKFDYIYLTASTLPLIFTLGGFL